MNIEAYIDLVAFLYSNWNMEPTLLKSCIYNGLSISRARFAQLWVQLFVFHRVQSILWTFVYMMCVLQKQSERPYSRTSPCGHLSNTDTSLLRTVNLVAGKCPNILCKNNLYRDNGQISAPEINLFYYRHSNDDSPHSTRCYAWQAHEERKSRNIRGRSETWNSKRAFSNKSLDTYLFSESPWK